MKENPEKVLESLSKSTVELAEAVSNYGALKVMFAVAMLIFLALIAIFIYQYIYLMKKMGNMEASSTRVLEYFNNVSNKSIGFNEAKSMVRNKYNELSIYSKYTVLKIKLENHIENREAIELKIKQLIYNYLEETTDYLNGFDYKEKPLDILIDFKDEKDVNALIELVISLVYSEDFKPSLIDQSIEIFIHGVKLKSIKRIDIVS